MTGQEKVDQLYEALVQGFTVYVTSGTRQTVISPANSAKFSEAGTPIFKAQDGSLMMYEGGRYVCADFCKIEAYK